MPVASPGGHAAMELFVASLVPLLAGPVLVWALQRATWAIRALDAFVVVGIGGLVLLHILPHAIADAGPYAFVAAAIGVFLPLLGGRLLSGQAGLVRTTTLAVGIVGLAVHAMLDGVALGGDHDHGHGSLLGLAVVLHRLPVGLAIWWLVRPKLGVRVAVAAVAAIVLSSAVGFLGAHSAEAVFHGSALSIFQALVAGTLLHVVVGHSTAPSQDGPSRWKPASAIGALLAVSALVLLSRAHPFARPHAEALTLDEAFLSLAVVSALPLLAAYGIAAVLFAVTGDRLPGWLRGVSPLGLAARGALAGLPVGTCSCAVSPTYRALIVQGVRPAAALAFLVAAPELGVASLLLSARLLGFKLTVLRVVVALAIGLVVGLAARKLVVQVEACTASPAQSIPPPRGSVKDRVIAGLRYGFIDLPDRTLPWLVIGLLLAALVEPLLDPASVAALPPGVDVPLLALAGLPLYVCASGSLPLVAVLLHKGVSAGAVVAFLVAGQATNPSTLEVLTRVHSRRSALLFAGGVGVLAVAAGYVIDALLPVPSRLSLHEVMTVMPQRIDLAAVAAMGVLVLLSLFRQGAVGFVRRVVTLHGHGEHEHAWPTDAAHEHHEHDASGRGAHAPTVTSAGAGGDP